MSLAQGLQSRPHQRNEGHKTKYPVSPRTYFVGPQESRIHQSPGRSQNSSRTRPISKQLTTSPSGSRLAGPRSFANMLLNSQLTQLQQGGDFFKVVHLRKFSTNGFDAAAWQLHQPPAGSRVKFSQDPLPQSITGVVDRWDFTNTTRSKNGRTSGLLTSCHEKHLPFCQTKKRHPRNSLTHFFVGVAKKPWELSG